MKMKLHKQEAAGNIWNCLTLFRGENIRDVKITSSKVSSWQETFISFLKKKSNPFGRNSEKGIKFLFHNVLKYCLLGFFWIAHDISENI